MGRVGLAVAVWVTIGVAPSAYATQDEMELPLVSLTRLLSPESSPGLHPLAAARATISVSPYYPLGGAHHRYHGRVAGDVALLSLGSDLVFHMGLSIQTVSDTGNDISFRLVRLYYEWLTAVDWRLGPGVMRIGMRHRCSHGADASVNGRILIRTGLEAAYALEGKVGNARVATNVRASVMVVGQNADHDFQPRGLISATGELANPLSARADWFVSVGLGMALVGDGGALVYTIADGTSDLDPVLLPAAATGVAYRSDALSGRLLIHYQRVLDSGFTQTALPTHLVSLRTEFEW
jgi:hypothetical protein